MNTTKQSKLVGRILVRTLIAVALLLVAIPFAAAEWRTDYPVIRVGIVAGTDPTYSRNAAEPFRLYLERTLGVRVELYATTDYSALISGQLTGRFDIAFLTATGFVSASAACGCVEPLAVPTDLDGGNGFYAILLAAPDGQIGGPEDLPGRSLAVSRADSLAGRILPLALFSEAEIDVAAINLVSTNSPEAAVASLIAGDADASLAWSSLAGDRLAGFSRGVLRQMVGRGLVSMDAIEIVWTSPLIPYGPVTALRELPEDLKVEIRAAMINLASVDPVANAAVNGALGGGFIAAEIEMFEPLMVLAAPAI
ncbi:MAG: phosphate/phosphite/phosphonate ABC transporter substrate-binding protein [Alphaproteobacteria bacterium]